MNRIILSLCVLVLGSSFVIAPAVAQDREIPGNALYNHLDTLRVDGQLERTSLHFHSYSDTLWLGDSETQEDEYGFRAYDPRNHLTYNFYSPYGGNDTGLWQGRGINNKLTGGAQYRSKHVSITLAPEVYFSQNLPYELVEPDPYSGSEYGHWLPTIDYPQRFGDSAIADWSPGQSEIRGNWRRLTVGFGTQNIWLGSAKRNSLLYSSNAAGFPHFDAGLLPTETRAGTFEFRMVWGWLKTSDYFDRLGPSQYESFINSVHFGWKPPFMDGLSLGIHRSDQVRLEDFQALNVFRALDFGVGFSGTNFGKFGEDTHDGKISLTLEWTFPSVGFQFYSEIARDDFGTSLEIMTVRKPEHTVAYTIGGKQVFQPFTKRDDRFALTVELTSTLWSRDYYIANGWGGGWYRHPIVQMGHTNDGQIIGAAIGTGSHNLYMALEWLFGRGSLGVFWNRNAKDSTNLYSFPVAPGTSNSDSIQFLWTQSARGITYRYELPDFTIYGELTEVFEINFAQIEENRFATFHGEIGIVYELD
jgi:hypothetical protein